MAVRAVLDTDVVVAARRAIQPGSPNAEVIGRWEAGEFTLLHPPDVLLEYAEKLMETGASRVLVTRFIARIFHLRHYPVDADDIAFLLCAFNGDATHFVACDPHVLDLQPHYPLAICEPLHFLAELRARC